MEKITLAEIFLDYMVDFDRNSIIKALEIVSNELKMRIGGDLNDGEKIISYFFNDDENEKGKKVATEHFNELIDFWDVFQEFDISTRTIRKEYFKDEAPVLKILDEILTIHEINCVKEGYLRCRKKEKFDELLDKLFEGASEKVVYVLKIQNGKIATYEKLLLHERFLYTSIKQIRDNNKNKQTLFTINKLHRLFISIGAIIIRKEKEYFGFWFYKSTYWRIPKSVADKIALNLDKYEMTQVG